MTGRILAILAVPLLLAGASLVHRQALDLRAGVSEVDAHVVVPAPQAARIMSLGANELAADLVWVRSLVYYGDGLINHTGMPDVEVLVALINALDPNFRRPYLWGAYATTYREQEATQKEYRASVDILRRAVARFPADWEFSWLLGLRLFFDLKPPDDKVRGEGAYYIERAMRLTGAPGDLPIIAATMRTKLGQKERALRELREMILTTEDEKARAELQERYSQMASVGAGEDIAAEAHALDEQWKRHLPYAPRSLYILVGPPPKVVLDPRRLAESDSAGPPVFGDEFGPPDGDENAHAGSAPAR